MSTHGSPNRRDVFRSLPHGLWPTLPLAHGLSVAHGAGSVRHCPRLSARVSVPRRLVVQGGSERSPVLEVDVREAGGESLHGGLGHLLRCLLWGKDGRALKGRSRREWRGPHSRQRSFSGCAGPPKGVLSCLKGSPPKPPPPRRVFPSHRQSDQTGGTRLSRLPRRPGTE